MTLSDLAKYSMIRSIRGLSAIAELIITAANVDGGDYVINAVCRCVWQQDYCKSNQSISLKIDVMIGPSNGNKKLSCRRERARRFVSLNILLSHSRSFEMTRLRRACVSLH